MNALFGENKDSTTALRKSDDHLCMMLYDAGFEKGEDDDFNHCFPNCGLVFISSEL